MTDEKIILNYRRLRHLKRCNNFPTILPEDVAQHSWFTAVLAMTIADQHNAWIDQHDFQETETKFYNRKVSVEEVLRKAILHDTSECITGDIPYNVKHLNEEAHKAIETAVNQKMDEFYKDCSHILKDYQNWEATCKEGVSGYIVNIADMLELAIYCAEEVYAGNIYMATLCTKAVKLVMKYITNTAFYETAPIITDILENIQKMDESDYTRRDTIKATLNID